MLPKALRLQKKEEFARVFRSGTPFFYDFLAVRVLRDASCEPGLRLGFSFSPKHLPRAVDRNRLRRLLSAGVADRQAHWPERAALVFYSRRKPLPDRRFKAVDLAPFLDDLFLTSHSLTQRKH